MIVSNPLFGVIKNNMSIIYFRTLVRVWAFNYCGDMHKPVYDWNLFSEFCLAKQQSFFHSYDDGGCYCDRDNRGEVKRTVR